MPHICSLSICPHSPSPSNRASVMHWGIAPPRITLILFPGKVQNSRDSLKGGISHQKYAKSDHGNILVGRASVALQGRSSQRRGTINF